MADLQAHPNLFISLLIFQANEVYGPCKQWQLDRKVSLKDAWEIQFYSFYHFLHSVV